MGKGSCKFQKAEYETPIDIDMSWIFFAGVGVEGGERKRKLNECPVEDREEKSG